MVDLPLWKMMEWVTVGKDYPRYQWENNIHVWNHQPVVVKIAFLWLNMAKSYRFLGTTVVVLLPAARCCQQRFCFQRVPWQSPPLRRFRDSACHLAETDVVDLNPPNRAGSWECIGCIPLYNTIYYIYMLYIHMHIYIHNIYIYVYVYIYIVYIYIQNIT